VSSDLQEKNVVAVLLDDGEWYSVVDASFEVDSFSFEGSESLLPVPGARFTAVRQSGSTAVREKIMIACPITSVKAVRLKELSRRGRADDSSIPEP
jgi:hypothetical protein